jgi:hypothetical protein
MGVGRIGRTRARPGSLEKGAHVYRRVGAAKRGSRRKRAVRHTAVGLILVVIIAVGYVIGSVRAFLFGP